MINYCCYYCQRFRSDTCRDDNNENRICYNALTHPQSKREGDWFCKQYENKECGETITGDGLIKEVNSKCWEQLGIG